MITEGLNRIHRAGGKLTSPVRRRLAVLRVRRSLKFRERNTRKLWTGATNLELPIRHGRNRISAGKMDAGGDCHSLSRKQLKRVRSSICLLLGPHGYCRNSSEPRNRSKTSFPSGLCFLLQAFPEVSGKGLDNRRLHNAPVVARDVVQFHPAWGHSRPAEVGLVRRAADGPQLAALLTDCRATDMQATPACAMALRCPSPTRGIF